MAENPCKELVVSVGSWKQLPVDGSLFEVEQELRKEIQEETKSKNDAGKKRLPSRKLIRSALAALDLPKETTNEQKSLYYQIIESRRDQIEEFGNTDTHPVALFWELKEFSKAIAKAKHLNRAAKGRELAKLAINNMVASLIGKDPAELGKSHLALQLLREDYVRNCLVQQYHEEVALRINRIRQYTENPSWEIASRAMEIAIPALDAVYIEVQQSIADQIQVKTVSENTSLQDTEIKSCKEPDYLSMLYALYENLLKDRPTIQDIDEFGASFGKMRFVLDNQGAFMENLKGHFQKKWRTLDASHRKAFEDAYEQYLILSANSTDRKAMENVNEFLAMQTTLFTYLKTTESWEKVKPLVWNDLCKYAVEMFRDIARRDELPYRYTEYHAKTAGAGFISVLTKNAHDQIRAKIHHAYRLLLSKAYLEEFNLDCANDLSLFLFGISKRIQSMEAEVKNELSELQKEFEQLPIITDSQRSKIQEFVQKYNQEVAGLFHTALISVEEVTQWIEISVGTFPLMDRFIASSNLLEKNCELIVKHLITLATEEIGEFYQKLVPASNAGPVK